MAERRPTTVVNVRGECSASVAARGIVYVGRAMPGRFAGHPLGNPFRPEKRTVATKDSCLEKYRRWLLARPNLAAELAALRGRRLGCWCGDWSPGEPDLACHAVILARMADSLYQKDAAND